VKQDNREGGEAGAQNESDPVPVRLQSVFILDIQIGYIRFPIPPFFFKKKKKGSIQFRKTGESRGKVNFMPTRH